MWFWHSSGDELQEVPGLLLPTYLLMEIGNFRWEEKGMENLGKRDKKWGSWKRWAKLEDHHSLVCTPWKWDNWIFSEERNTVSSLLFPSQLHRDSLKNDFLLKFLPLLPPGPWQFPSSIPFFRHYQDREINCPISINGLTFTANSQRLSSIF